MNYNFDQVIDRRHTASYKWDQSEKLFGDADILPLWVADMDFKAPQEVVDAIVSRAEHGIYGYSFRPQSYYDAIMHWQLSRHQWEVKQSWLTSSPGVVTALSLLIDVLSEPGDQVILQAPVYYPFYDVITMNNREIVNNPLRLENGTYVIDFQDLEEKMKSGAKLMLLCSPHNPGGRVWSKAELTQLGELCVRYGVFVIADEIHGDLALPGNKHIPFASISESFAAISATCIAPTKTFNLPGLQTSVIIISDSKVREKYNHRLRTFSLHMEGCFGQVAVESSYTYGAQWLDQFLLYVQGNLAFATEYLNIHLPQVEVMQPEGGYLLWMDCRKIASDAQTLKEIMYRKAKVAFNEGSIFGEEGEGFLRINVACPRSIVEEGLRRFVTAVNKDKRHPVLRYKQSK